MPKKHHIPIMDSGAIETLLGLLSIQKPNEFSKSGVQLVILQFEWHKHYRKQKSLQLNEIEERFLKAVDIY